jgi:hypothetical protein
MNERHFYFLLFNGVFNFIKNKNFKEKKNHLHFLNYILATPLSQQYRYRTAMKISSIFEKFISL